MAAHPGDIELVLEIRHDANGDNAVPYYRLFVGGNPVQYAVLRGYKRLQADALINSVLAELRLAGAAPADFPGPPGRH